MLEGTINCVYLLFLDSIFFFKFEEIKYGELFSSVAFPHEIRYLSWTWGNWIKGNQELLSGPKYKNIDQLVMWHVCIQNTWNFLFKIRETVEKVKTDVDSLRFVLIMEQKFPKYFVKLNFFSFLKPNVVYLLPFLTFLQFPKFWKQNFMYFGHKHVET